MLRAFAEQHIDEDLTNADRDFDNALLFNCKFDNLRGRTFKNCDLNRSEFLTDRIEDLLGFTITLDCHSFGNVTLSETIFDAILLLLYKTRGNDSKRRKLLEIIGKEKVEALLKQLGTLEQY
jgi:hypothetical protein